MEKGKRTSVSYKDVQVLFMAEGVESVAKMGANPKTIRRAAKILSTVKKYQRSPEKEELAKLSALAPEKTHGRKAPTVGDSRSYKAQKVKKGKPFLRLPLDTLGIPAGGPVHVLFCDGEIRVRRDDPSS